MNNSDKKRLLYLCSICPKDNLVVFSGGEAYVNARTHTVAVNLSRSISTCSIGISPSTLQSIISTMTDEDIEVTQLKDFKFKFKSKGMQRTISATDAEYSSKIEVDEIVDTYSIMNPEEFAKSIAFVSNFSYKDGLASLASVYVRIVDNYANIYATDGASMGYRRYTQKLPFEDSIDLIIPQQHMQPVIRTLTDEGSKTANIQVDKNNVIQVSTSNFRVILCRSTDSFKDLVSIMDREAAMSSDRKIKNDSHSLKMDNTELKQSLSNIISMFVKSEFPYVDIHIYKDRVNLETETLVRGYDCFRASIPAESTGEFSSRVSPIMFLKALSKVKDATIYWRDSTNGARINPFVADNGSEMVFFAPMKIPPKEDDSYE